MVFFSIFLILVVTALLFIAGRKIAIIAGLHNAPEAGKPYAGIIGGIIIVPVLLFLSYMIGIDFSDHAYFITALLFITIIGLIDDIYHLRPFIKLSGQIIAACLVVYGEGIILESLGTIWGQELLLGSAAPIFTIICLVFIMNAMNLIDGLDGLCGGVSLIIMVCLSYVSFFTIGADYALFLYLLIFPLLTFMVFNFRFYPQKRALVFLGDSGSLSLGLMIGVFAINLSQQQNLDDQVSIPPVVMAWILSYPVFDALAVFIIRLIKRRSPFYTDRTHLHYLLYDHNIGVIKIVWFLYALTLFYAAVGIGGIFYFNLDQLHLAVLWVFFLMAHCGLVYYLSNKSYPK